MDNTEIKKWFPKSIFQGENVLTMPQLQDLNRFLTPFLDNRSLRTGMLNVESLHSTINLVNYIEMNVLKKNIMFGVSSFAEALGYSEKQISTMDFINIWANRSYQGDFNFPHVHSGSQFSGVFYVCAPDNSTITFYNDITKNLKEPECYNELSFNYVRYSCITNSILIFQSDFLHGNEFQQGGEKIAVSFNIKMDSV